MTLPARLFVVAVVVSLLAAPHAGAAELGQACKSDGQCAVGSICDENVCTAVQNRRVVPLPPLFWWQRHNERTWLAFPLLLSGGSRDNLNDITEAVFLLAGYYRKHGDDTWRVLAPLFFEHENKDSRSFLAPLVWAKRTPTHSTTVVFPVLWHSADATTGNEHVLVLPLFDSESEDHGKRQRVISVLGAYEHNEDLGLSQVLIWVPPVFHRTDAKRTIDVVPPLFTHWTTTDEYSSGTIVGPVAHTSDPHGSTTTVFPLYWRFHDNAHDATTQLLFPVAGMHHHQGAAGAFIGPLYAWGSKNGRGGWGAGLAPLVFFGRDGARRHQLVLPLFAHVSDSDAGSSTTAVGPLYIRKTRDGGDGGLFPLVFAGRHGASRYAFVTPLFWHHGDDQLTTDVIGPLYFQHGQRGFAFGLAPLVFFGKLDGRSHQVLFPLFWHSSDPAEHKERLVIGPYYHRRDGAESADVLFPLVYLRRSPGEGFGIWPVGGWLRHDGVDTTIVFPFVQRTNTQRSSRTTMFFPLLTLHDSPNYAVKVFFPILWRVRDGRETNTAVIPFYLGGRGPGFNWDAVFPFFVQTRTDVARTTVLGPLWYRARKDGGRGLGFFPLFAYGKKLADGKTSTWFGMPGFFRDENQFSGRGHLWLLDFFYTHDQRGYTAGLIPVLFAWRRGTASKILTPGFYRQADSARDYSLNVFTLLFYGHEGRSAHTFGLFPVLMAATHADNSWWAELLPIFYAHRRTDGLSVYTLLGGYASSPTGKRLYAGPIYWRKDAKQRTFGLFPIFYYGRNLESGSSTALLLPLFLDWRNGEGHELQAYSPLVWRYHTIESTTTVGLPLVFDIHRFSESRTTAVLPFLVRSRSDVEKTSSYTLPFLLTWWSTPDGDRRHSDFVFFPIIWRYSGAKGSNSSTTIVAPLVWDFRRGDSRTTVVFPIVAHWKRPEVDHWIVFNTYYSKGLGPREGSWYVNFFPLITVGRARKKDLEWYFLEGLFGYWRQGRNRNLRLFWVLDFPLQPLRSTDLSMIGSTPPESRELF